MILFQKKQGLLNDGLKEIMISIYSFINNNYFSKEQISLIGIKTTFTLKKKLTAKTEF